MDNGLWPLDVSLSLSGTVMYLMYVEEYVLYVISIYDAQSSEQDYASTCVCICV